MIKPCNDCVYERNRADVDESCDCFSLEIYNAYQQGRAEAINDFIIMSEHLDIDIRCAMCANMMRSNRGCDGGCAVDESTYKKVMDVVNSFINEIEQLREQKK